MCVFLPQAKQEYIRNKNVVTEIQAAKKELEANIQRKKDMVAELLRSAQEESQVLVHLPGPCVSADRSLCTLSPPPDSCSRKTCCKHVGSGV